MESLQRGYSGGRRAGMSSSALLSVFLRPTCCRCWKATLCSLSLASMKKTNWASTSSMVRYHTRWDHTGTLGCRRHDVGEARSTQEKTVHSDWNRARLGLRTPLEVHRWARASRAPLQNLLWDRFRRAPVQHHCLGRHHPVWRHWYRWLRGWVEQRN